MGCHDIPNLKIWRQNLDKIDQRILMYGEPWMGGDNNGVSNGVTKSTLSQLTRIGAFNEGYSDSLKGDHESAAAKGFLNGASDTEVRKAGAGQASDFPSAKVNQFINYTDNHDNFTMFDKLLATNNTSGYVTGKDGTTSSGVDLYTKNKTIVDNPSANVIKQMKLGLTSALTSQGIPFTVAGTEFCRTKYGDANSYRTPDPVNAINWNRAEKFAEVADYYAGLISIRKAFNAFTNSTSVSTTSVSGCTAWKISNSATGQWKTIIVALNNTAAAKSISVSGSWTVVANGTKAGPTSLGTASGSYSVPAYSGVILVDSASFGSYTQPNPGISTVITEHYTRDSATGSYVKAKTETAKYKEGQTWRASKNLAILFDHNFDKVESTANNATSGSVVAGSTITVKYYYTRYIKSGYLTINYLNTVGGTKVKTPIKYHLRQGDVYSIPANSVMGYELDTTKYPAMTRGNFNADSPATFNFYYKALTNNTTRVHYYVADTKFKNMSSSQTLFCYAYDDEGNEPLDPWPLQKKAKAGMKNDTTMGTGWKYIDIPTSSCYVMFHNDAYGQVPGQGEQGYVVSGEAWIKSGVVSFNNKIVTSHIDLKTGKQLAADVTNNYTNVSSNTTYTTSPSASLSSLRSITPANAAGYYEAGVTNVVYLYTDKNSPDPTQPSTQPATQPATQPVTQPVTQPATQPVTQPATQPSTPPATAPAGNLLVGDADEDGQVTIIDATRIQRVLVGLNSEGPNYKKVADADGDGQVTIVDATYIQRWLAGIKDAKSHVGETITGGTSPATQPVSDPTSPVVNPTSPVIYPTEWPTFVNTEPTDEPDPSYGPDPETVTVYFTNNKGWSAVYAYVWGEFEGSWPGEELFSVGTNDYGESIYSVTLSTTDNVIFNDGDSQQTTDIVVSSLSGNAVYCETETDAEGHYLYGEWNYDPEYVEPGPGPVNPGSGDKVYMSPSSEWKQAGARFAAYFFEGGEPVWVNMKYAGDSLYSADIPDGYGMVIFVRMNGASTENNWDNKWNQTDDLPVDPGSTYQVEGWGK